MYISKSRCTSVIKLSGESDSYTNRNAPTPEIAQDPSSVWWSSVVGNFIVLPSKELPEGVHCGVSFTSFAVNVPQHLRWLCSRIKSLGGRSIRGRLSVAEGAERGLLHAVEEGTLSRLIGQNDLGAVINATGLGARKLVPDEKVFPTRGQTVLVRGEAKGVTTRVGKGEGEIGYVIPRPGGGTSILGGTKEAGIW